MACCGKLCQREASKKPVKRYNALVPDVFAASPPPWDAPLDAATRRKIDKLVDYVELNVQRAPKVSRRLWRVIQREHGRSVGQCKVRGDGSTSSRRDAALSTTSRSLAACRLRSTPSWRCSRAAARTTRACTRSRS